jgi:hypothetical protein
VDDNYLAIVRMVHEPTEEVHRETVILDDLILIYGFRRDSMGLGRIRVGEHMYAEEDAIKRLVKQLPDYKNAINRCQCEAHRDYRMEVDYALQEH